MFGFGNSGKSSVYGVLIDIGSSTVGVAIVATETENNLPILIYTHRVTMRITGEAKNKVDSIKTIQETLFSALDTLSSEGIKILGDYDSRARISKIYVTCSSPWSYTIARMVDYKDNDPFKVTGAMIKDLVKGAEDQMIEYLAKETSLGEDGFEVVEQATVDISINEYAVENPINMKGKELSLSHIAGLIPREILESVHEVEHRLFPNAELRIHTSMLSMYCVLRDLFPRVYSFGIIDVRGEATEFGIVENNLLIENTFTSHGSSTFIRDIMNETGKPESDIRTSLLSFGDETELVLPPFTSQMQKYEDSIKDALLKIMERRMLPNDIIITAPKPMDRLFKHMITEAFKTATGKVPNVMTIESKLIEEISEGAEDDVYLALGARFFHKLHGCGELN